MNKNKNWLILPLIIVLAAVIRLMAIFNFGTFTFDDIFSVHFAGINLEKMFSYLKDEVHPPLFYFLLHFWLALFGQNEIISRFFSLIFNLATIVVLYFLGKKILNRWLAGLAGLIFALSYFQIFTAAEIRMYSQLEFFGSLSLLLFWQIMVERKTKLYWLYFLITAACLFTHLGGLFVICTEWLWLLIFYGKKQIGQPALKKYILSQIFLLALWLPWLALTFLPKLGTVFSQGWYFQLAHNTDPTVGVFDFFFIFLKNYWLRLISATVILAAPFMILLWPDKKLRERLPGKIDPAWLLLSWVLPAFLVSWATGVNYIRIFIFPYLALYFIVAYLFYILWQNQKYIFWPLIIIWLMISAFNLFANLPLAYSRWDLACADLSANTLENSQIILSRFPDQLNFQHYCPALKFLTLYPFTDKLNFDQRLVINNWRLAAMKSAPNIAGLSSTAGRIIIVHEGLGDLGLEKNLENNLIKNNWQKTKNWREPAYFGPEIIIYEK